MVNDQPSLDRLFSARQHARHFEGRKRKGDGRIFVNEIFIGWQYNQPTQTELGRLTDQQNGRTNEMTNMTIGRDTYYCEKGHGGIFSYWTYSEGRRYRVSKNLVLKAILKGDKLVTVQS
jgi:hypothetical protein